MTEIELWNMAIGNREVLGLYNIGYGILSLVIIVIAYLVRHQPMWFRSISAAIAVFFIFNTFTMIVGNQNAFFGLASVLSTMAAEGKAPLMQLFLDANGGTAGAPVEPPMWQVLGPISMLAHAGLSVYLFVAAKWDGESA
jgi:hypothetical protein